MTDKKPDLTLVSDNVTPLRTSHSMNSVEPEVVLEKSIARGLREVLVIGVTEDDHTYYAASTGNKAILIWRMEQFKHYLLEID